MAYFEKIIKSPERKSAINDKEITDSEYEQRALIDSAVATSKELVADLDIPEKLKPALHLYFFNNYIARQGNVPEGGYKEEIKKGLSRFQSYIEAEGEAEKKLILPTIGIEIEIPGKFEKITTLQDHDFFDATQKLGIPAGYDQIYEFATGYSYSAKTQSMLAHELIRGGFIQTKTKEGKNQIDGKGDFSLHVNLGFPNKFVSSKLEAAADVLTNALTYGFTSPERLKKRKTSTRVNFELAEAAQQSTDSKDNWKRLEIRSLEVRDETLYRLLSEAQLLGAALFSNFSTANSEDSHQIVL